MHRRLYLELKFALFLLEQTSARERARHARQIKSIFKKRRKWKTVGSFHCEWGYKQSSHLTNTAWTVPTS